MQQRRGIVGLPDAPETGAWLLQSVVPIKHDFQGFARALSVCTALCLEPEQKTPEIDDVVTLLPGVTQITLTEPCL